MLALQHKQKTNALPALLVVLSLVCFMKIVSTRHYTAPTAVPNIWTPPTDSVIVTH